jgi:hypothetical protein
MRYRFIVHIREAPDPDLGLIAAECVHHLRAGLDNLMWSIVPKNVRNRKLQFPIHDDPIRFLCEAFPTLHRLPAKLFEAIEWCQPYNRDNLTFPERLVALNAMWNADKHRAPLAVGAAVKMFAIASYGETPLHAQLTDHLKALYEGKEIGWASGLPPGMEDQLHPPILFGIAFTTVNTERVYQLHALEKMHRIITDEVVPAIRSVI